MSTVFSKIVDEKDVRITAEKAVEVAEYIYYGLFPSYDDWS